jgi:hypothetical protein
LDESTLLASCYDNDFPDVSRDGMSMSPVTHRGDSPTGEIGAFVGVQIGVQIGHTPPSERVQPTLIFGQSRLAEQRIDEGCNIGQNKIECNHDRPLPRLRTV